MKLKNGLNVIIKKRESKNTTVVFTVNTGSNGEEIQNNGISHFYEHIMFEGTKKRPSASIVTREIEAVGGEFNAMTSKNRTYFHIKVPHNHADIALEIMADILLNPLFDEKIIEKEKQVICSEIDMIVDDPKYHQWTLFEKKLFKTHPAKHSIAGSKKVVKSITQKKLQNHHNKWCTAHNTVLTIAGNIPKNINTLIKPFEQIPKTKVKRKTFKNEKNTQQSITQTRPNIQQSYIVIGYKVPNVHEKESIALDIIEAILSMGQSGWLFEEFRIKRGIAYDVRATNETQPTGSIFAVNISTQKQYIPLAKKIIFQLFEKIKTVDKKTINEAKEHLIGKYLLENEDNLDYALNITDQFFDKTQEYCKLVKSITQKEVHTVAKKYLTEKYTIAQILQK